MSGQPATRRRVRARFLAVPVAALMGLLLAVPAVQPAGASPVRTASSMRPDRAGPSVVAQGSFTDDIQKMLLKFAAEKLAGFAFSKLGLDKLLGDATMQRLDELQAQIAEIAAQQKVLQDSINAVSADIKKIMLEQYEVKLTDIASHVDTLYNYFYVPALAALTEYVRLDLESGGNCDADPCKAARVKYEGADGSGGLRQKFLDQFTVAGAASYGEELHRFIMPGPSADSVMSAYGDFLATKGNGFLTADDSAKILNYYNYWGDYRALAMWMIAQWMSVEDPQTGFDTVLSQIDSWQTAEYKALPPPIPANTVIVLPANAALRTDDTRNLPMWGFNVGAAAGGQPTYWLPSRNDLGVPKIISQMNSTAAGYGFKDWKVPSRAELDALLSRGPADKTARTFLSSLNAGPQWDIMDNDLYVAPYIWTTQAAGIPSWDRSPTVDCFYFNSLTASKVIIKTYTGYVHTAVGPVSNSLSGYPANYRNYNRPMPYGYNGLGNIIDLEYIDLTNNEPWTVAHCDTIMNDDITRAFNTGTTIPATLLATRSTGDVNFLP